MGGDLEGECRGQGLGEAGGEAWVPTARARPPAPWPLLGWAQVRRWAASKAEAGECPVSGVWCLDPPAGERRCSRGRGSWSR